VLSGGFLCPCGAWRAQTLNWLGLGQKEDEEACAYHKKIMMNMSGRAEPGNFLAIMGPEGSGKSLLLHMLAGRVRADNDSGFRGSILYNGEAFADSMRREIGLVEQDAELEGEPHGQPAAEPPAPVPGHLPLCQANCPCARPPAPVPGHLPLCQATCPCARPPAPVPGPTWHCRATGPALTGAASRLVLSTLPAFRAPECGSPLVQLGCRGLLWQVKETLMSRRSLAAAPGTEEIDRIVRVEHVLDSLELTQCVRHPLPVQDIQCGNKSC